MIIIKLTGGLGNQLFQYSYGRALSLETGETLLLDTSWYKGRRDRTYLLDNFSIHSKKANIFHKLLCSGSYIEDTRGEWHSEKHFLKYASTIASDLTPKKSITPESSMRNSVSIHLRGGDYVQGDKSNFHGTCSPEYYTGAIQYIKDKISNPHFYIFTDDIGWAKKYINFPEPYTFISDSTHLVHEELILMSQCEHNIIANSTFSWWAAWLNNNPEKIVIAPKKWFNNQDIPSDDIVPASWITI